MAYADDVARANDAAKAHLGGESVTYAPQTGSPVVVTGIFDENYTLVQPGEVGVEQIGPVVFLELADLPVNPDDDEPTLTIRTVNYTVRERQVDGLGGVLLLLHQVT